MVMQREPIPAPGRYDIYTRIDELLQNNLAAQEELLNLIRGKPLTQDVVNQLITGGKIPIQTKTFALDTAREDSEVNIQGIGILAVVSSGVMSGIGVRLTLQNAAVIYFNDINPIPYPFAKVWLSHPAVAGATLTLYYSEEVIPWASAYPVTLQASQQFNILRSDKDVNFTGALAQGAKEDENITGLLTNKLMLTGVIVQSIQRLHYKLLLWYTDAFDDADLDLDQLCAEIDVDLASYGIQIGSTNQWYLDVRNLHVDYADLDATKEVHISLYNADPTAKLASTAIAVSGAVAMDGAVATDETTEANSAAANDMTVLPAVPAVNDAYYFGAAYTFDGITLNIGTQGAGSWTITWEYYNGSAWAALVGVTDDTTGFTAAAGSHNVVFTRPADWATVAVGGLTHYWIRARVSVYASVTTQPLGTQAWILGEGDVSVGLVYEPRA